MQEESNLIKDYLFDYLSKSAQDIQKLVSEKKFSDIINRIVADCYDKVILMDEKEQSLGTLATGILHFLLTNALISSQRKVEHNGIEIDIVIPDLKTLEKDPKKTLIIYIPKTSNTDIIKKKLTQLEKIQSEKQNIWLVLSENLNIENKSFVLDKEKNTFSKVIFEIAEFVNVQGENKFKILKV